MKNDDDTDVGLGAAAPKETTQHDRITGGLETAPPEDRAKTSSLKGNPRPMTGSNGIDSILNPLLVDAVEANHETIEERLRILQNLASIVVVMRRESPSDAERFQLDLIEMYNAIQPNGPIEVVAESLKTEAKKLPNTIVAAIVSGVVLLLLAYLCVACGLPSIL